MLRSVENLTTPIADRRSRLLAKRVDGNGIDERRGTRAGERDTRLANHPPNEDRVAVVRPHEGLARVVEIPERCSALLAVAEHGEWEVRAFQMLRPL